MRPSRWCALLLTVVLAGCGAEPPKPAAAEMRTGAPPWDAPRDAVSYVDAAGFERLPLDFRGPVSYVVRLAVTIDGTKIVVPANIGIDRLRAEQAAIHTHADDGVIWVEPRSKDDRPTLKQFFTLWGVRYDAKCLGDACGGISVLVNGDTKPWNTTLSREAAIIVQAKR